MQTIPAQERTSGERIRADLRDDGRAPGRSAYFRVVMPFALAYALSQFVRSANAVIAPELTAEFALSASALGLLTSTYFVVFAAAQLPIGLLLDRYGSRAVETSLLIVLAAGCLLFSVSWNFASLGVSRAIIGLGGSVCLMAAFKAIVEQFSGLDRAPMNSLVLAIGGLGSIAATVPLANLLPLIGWRGAFAAVAATTLACALALFAVAPRRPANERNAGGLGDAWRGASIVLRSRRFWCFAPHMMVASGGFMAVQSLWAVPWMMEVASMSRSAAAGHLFALGIAVIVGHLSNASVVAWLAKRQISPYRLLAWGGAAALACEFLIFTDAGYRLLAWSMYGIAFSTLSLSYPLLTSEFPAELAGRLNTALNLAVFAGGFVIQWGFGLIVDAVGLLGHPEATGLRVAYAVWMSMQAAGFAWLVARYRKA